MNGPFYLIQHEREQLIIDGNAGTDGIDGGIGGGIGGGTGIDGGIGGTGIEDGGVGGTGGGTGGDIVSIASQ